MKPTSFTLEGKRVDIRWKSWLVKGGRRIFGLYEAGAAARPRISVDDGIPLYDQRVTLMHETMHHCMRLAKTKLPKAQEEEFCDAIDAWLVVLLQENPKLVEFLTKVP